MPDLFRAMPEMLTASGPIGDDIPPSPLTTELPYYLAVRLNRRKTKVTKHRHGKGIGNGDWMIGIAMQTSVWQGIP